MLNILVIAAAIILLTGLLNAEKKESLKGILLTKPFLSALFIAALFLGFKAPSTYFYLIFAGLIFCYIGDICLAFFFKKKIFTIGLAAFLIGHILYAAAFFYMSKIGVSTWISLALVLIVGSVVFVKLKPYLGTMFVPVIVYIVIISIMVVAAATLLSNSSLSYQARLMSFCGALCFYVSDIFVARHRFVKKEFINRLIGLPLYYTAQFLIAFSAGLI